MFRVRDTRPDGYCLCSWPKASGLPQVPPYRSAGDRNARLCPNTSLAKGQSDGHSVPVVPQTLMLQLTITQGMCGICCAFGTFKCRANEQEMQTGSFLYGVKFTQFFA